MELKDLGRIESNRREHRGVDRLKAPLWFPYQTADLQRSLLLQEIFRDRVPVRLESAPIRSTLSQNISSDISIRLVEY